jgi:hypothetical protein
MLADSKRELFAQNVAVGCKLTEAARRAGFDCKRIHNAASRMSKEPQVAARITELRAVNCDLKTLQNGAPDSPRDTPDVATKNWVLVEVINNHRLARAAGDLNVSRQCLELVARLKGYLVERKDSQHLSVRLNVNDPKELSSVLRQQLESLPATERSSMVELLPKQIADAIEIQADPILESPDAK